MFMDPYFSEFSGPLNGFQFGDEIVLPTFDQNVNRFKVKDEPLDLSFLDIPTHPPDPEPSPSNSTPSSGSSEVNSPDDNEFSDGVLKFLNQILMEEKIEEKPCMFHDPLALQAAEKSFYEVLGEKYPPSSNQTPVDVAHNVESPSEYSTSNGASAGNYVDPQWVGDSVDFKSSAVQNHFPEYFSSSTSKSSSQWSLGSGNSFSNTVTGQLDSSMRTHLVPNIFSDSKSILQFKRGMEEASKFLPSSTPLVIDMYKYALLSDSKEGPPEIVVKVEKDEEISPNSSRGRKHYHRQDSVIVDERSSKQSAVYVEEEVELSEMFDKVLLCEPCCDNEEPSEVSPILHHENGQTMRSNGVRSQTKKRGSETEAVDLRTLLISCAQSVAADDRRTAYEQLKLIRQHSSPSGDASQRLADIFANSLEARMAGTGTQIYAALASKRISATEKLKAYEVYLSACPSKKISIFFANKMILDRASNAKVLHIIDFGIQYGFQWPVLIQLLSKRSGGVPKLRITGIELPQPGFRPAEYMEATGRRLASYCERFNVSFEYHAIATQNWETIKVEDLKIESNEFVAVNCLFRFKNLLDETVVVNSPRDDVLKLIRKVNPDIFVHAVVNGSYSAPFFVTRFREALFHYYATFDMFDATLPREDQQRLNFEREFCGREVMNVLACEGSERVERPETYKQWQVRNMRAGFKLLPLNQELLKKLRRKVKAGYHKDFMFDDDGQWMLQGWKGRILCATSAWVPA